MSRDGSANAARSGGGVVHLVSTPEEGEGEKSWRRRRSGRRAGGGAGCGRVKVVGAMPMRASEDRFEQGDTKRGKAEMEEGEERKEGSGSSGVSKGEARGQGESARRVLSSSQRRSTSRARRQKNRM